jgi:UDP-glucose 4-epimerase
MSRYLIFGGTGSLGKKLIERLSPPDQVAVYSRDEAKHWTIRNELAARPRASDLKFYVGDIRDPSRVKDVIRQTQPTHIIIAAALKQVDTCELSPTEAIATNLQGTVNVVNALNELRPTWLEACLFVSTDKACAPVNVYGMCKAASERVVTSQSMTGHQWIRYLAVRYGNVLESRGSIIPLFKYQAETQPYLTVTDPNMTRYVMTLDDSVDLILTAFKKGESGETWIPRLPAMKIGDLAEIFAERHGKQVKIIGLRPGEKMHEDLINASESVRTTLSNDKQNYIIGPAHLAGKNDAFKYSSNHQVFTKNQLKEHLTRLGIIDKSSDEFEGRSIEEIRK